MTDYLAQAQARQLSIDFVDQRNLETIDKFGWTVIAVFDPEGNDPPFTYTIGARQASGGRCPEIAVMGLEGRAAGLLLNSIVRSACDGSVLSPGFNDNVLGGGYLAYFGPVEPEYIPEHFPRGEEFARFFEPDQPYRILQLVWPDKRYRFPWDDGYDTPARQTVMCTPPLSTSS